MSVIGRLATSLGRRDEVSNVALARSIVEAGDENGVKDLVENLANKDTGIQSDCVKVLYEIGERKPALVAAYAKEFIALLGSKNNRLVWGAMTALDAITLDAPAIVYPELPMILKTADEGSVITRDHLVGILVKLASLKEYRTRAFPLLAEQLRSCPANQLPMYAERASAIIKKEDRAEFVKVLASRLEGVEKEPKRRRIEKVMKKFGSESA